MTIHSAKFIKGIVEEDELLRDGKPQVAFIGRSNVGKSSTINTLTHQKGLARTSSTPGRTQQINVFLINRSFYLIDLPGYGFAKNSWEGRTKLQNLIRWYFLHPGFTQKKILLIIDAKIGPTKNDLDMIKSLEDLDKTIVIAANKIDKIPKPDYDKQLKHIQKLVGKHVVIPYSITKYLGIDALAKEILADL